MDVSDPCKGGEGTPYCPLYIDSTCTNPLYCCKTQIYKRYEKSGNNGIDAWGCLPKGYHLIPFEPFPAPCGTDMVCHYAACEGENDVAASFYISGCCPESCLVVSDGGGGLNCVDPDDTSSWCEVSEGWYK